MGEISQNVLLNNEFSGNNNPITFLADTDFNAWSEIGPLEERFRACDVSGVTAKTLTTRALVESVAHYPLNYLLFAYDDPLEAVRLILRNSQLHRELLSRNDALDQLIQFFSETEMIQVGKELCRSWGIHLTYTDELFFEYFLLYWVKNNGIEKGVCPRLLKAIEMKYNERVSQREIYSDFSLLPLRLLRTGVDQQNSLNPPLRTATTIYTPMGHALAANQITQDYSPAESNYITTYFSTLYPNAIVIRPASCLYNCHSYAWYSDSSTNNIWLNSHLSENYSQLRLYWTFDWYKEWNESTSEKATYMQSSADDSHSARITSSGAYISKWGSGPLMQHSKAYCPYSTSVMHYYRAKTFPENEITIVGDGVVLPSTTHNYYIDGFDWEADPYDYDVTVTFLPSPSQSNTHNFTTINKTSQLYGLECYEYGTYKIRAEYERMPGYLSYGEKLVACVGARTMQRIRDEKVTDLEAFLRDNWESISE